MNGRGNGIENVQLVPLRTRPEERTAPEKLEGVPLVRRPEALFSLCRSSAAPGDRFGSASEAARTGENVCHLERLIVCFNDRSNYSERRLEESQGQSEGRSQGPSQGQSRGQCRR